MKTIIEMAREAALQTDSAGVWVDDGYITNQLERFAELVRANERERLTDAAMKAAGKAVDVAMAIEREAILELVDSYAKNNTDLADAIRARGNT